MNIMCRTLLQGTLAAGAARRTGAVESPAPILRAIAATGERIPVVGIGSNAYDVESAEDLAARRAVLRKFPVLGGSLIDTARVAGKPLPEWAKEFDATTWAQFMLKYNLSHPAITAVIPGTTTLDYLRDNQAAGRGRLPDAALRRRMEQCRDALA